MKVFDEKRYQKGEKKYRNTPAKSQTEPKSYGVVIQSSFGEHGAELVKRYEPHIRDAGYEMKKIATGYICYQAMGQAVKDLYKDELLKEAGISI